MKSDELLDPSLFVKKKRLRSKVCPDCGKHFGRVGGSLVCVGCGFELDADGEPLTYFYGIISVCPKKDDNE